MNTLEPFRRAMVQSDQDARRRLEQDLDEIMRDWLHRHPQRAEACRFDSEEHYIAQAFERFWRDAASHQQLEFTQLAMALRYLLATLNGVLLETLRAHTRPGAGRSLDQEKVWYTGQHTTCRPGRKLWGTCGRFSW